MSEALTGFGSGPYNTLNYDRSWVTGRVTLGVSIADDYSVVNFISTSLGLGTVVETVKLADGYIYASIALGVGAAIPAVSIAGVYTGALTLGSVLEHLKTGGAEYYVSTTLGVSLADDQAAVHEVHDTVTLGASIADAFLADLTANVQLSLGSGFLYNNTASFHLNSTVTFATQITAEVSSTGRFIEQWTSVPDVSAESWTSVPLGFT